MTYWYLATPYSKYPQGLEAAHKLACEQAAFLIAAKIPVYSPIAHTHPIAVYGDMDPFDHGIWLPADEPLMKAAMGLIVLRAIGWDKSFGISEEIKAFNAAGKPLIYMDPNMLPTDLLSR